MTAYSDKNKIGKPCGFYDRGGASRFFYQAKASQNERWFYCKICKQAHPMKERDNHIHNPPDNTRYQHLEFSSNSKTVRTHTIFS